MFLRFLNFHIAPAYFLQVLSCWAQQQPLIYLSTSSKNRGLHTVLYNNYHLSDNIVFRRAVFPPAPCLFSLDHYLTHQTRFLVEEYNFDHKEINKKKMMKGNIYMCSSYVNISRMVKIILRILYWIFLKQSLVFSTLNYSKSN